MGRSPCCAKEGLNRGSWTAHEDRILTEYIKAHGEGHWRNLPKRAGLKRCGKSCRLRWLNYLRPDIKRGNISQDEEELIIRLHKLLGNRWSLIAGRLPGRTDNEIKNYWNTNLCKKVKADSEQISSINKHSEVLKHKHFQKNTNKLKLSLKTKRGSISTLSKSDNYNHQVVVRTKAVKCNKIFINPIVLHNNDTSSVDHHQQSYIEKSSGNLGGPISLDQEFDIFPSTIVESDHQDNNISSSSDLIMNFNVEDFCLPDFLNSDYDYLNYKNIDDHNGSNTSGTNEILDLDEELLIQEWNGKDCVDEFNLHNQIFPSCCFNGEEC